MDSTPVIPRIERLSPDERKNVEEDLKTANSLAQRLQEVAFTNKWCKKDKAYAGVWIARGTGYPIVGRFFLKQIGLDRVEGFVEQESRAKIYGKCNANEFDLNVQWSNGDLTNIGVMYNPETKESKQLQGRMMPLRTSMKFPYVHYRLIPGTNEYDEDFGNKGSLNKYVFEAKKKGLYDKLLDNFYAVSQLYENISFERLADLFGMDARGAELLAQCLLKCGQVTGAVDQEDQMVIFEKPREALKKFNGQVRDVCLKVQRAYDAIAKEHPKLQQQVKNKIKKEMKARKVSEKAAITSGKGCEDGATSSRTGRVAGGNKKNGNSTNSKMEIAK